MRAYDVAIGMLSKSPDTVLRMSRLVLKMATKSYKERERMLFKAYDMRMKIKTHIESFRSVYSERNMMTVEKALWLIEHSKEESCPCYIVLRPQSQNGEMLQYKYGFELLESKREKLSYSCIVKCPNCGQKFKVKEEYISGINTTVTHERLD